MTVDRPPHFPNTPGLPGAIIHPKETAEDAVRRIIEERGKLDAKKIYLEQLYTFSRADRDPRGRVVAVSYLGLVSWENLSEQERESGDGVRWADAHSLKKLAYDHDEMLHMALKRLASRATYTTILSKLMPEEFTLTELERAYESVIGEELDKRNFRKKILKLKVLKEVPGKRTGGRFRPAQLYRFASKHIQEIEVI